MRQRPVVEVAASLREVVERENAALRESDFRRAAGYLKTKQACVEAFAALGRLRAPDGAEQSADAADQALCTAIRQLDSVLDENRLLLERAMQVQSRVLSLLADCARQGEMAEGQYGRQGAYSRASGRPARAVSRHI